MAKKLILDADNTIWNSTKAFVDVHKIFNGKSYLFGDEQEPMWEKVRRYDFTDQIPKLTSQLKHAIFDSVLFYDKLEYYDNAKEIIEEICRKTEVHVISMSSYKSATLKGEKLQKDLPLVKFQPIIFPNYRDKSHIDMRGGIFLDDVSKNLHTSSADRNICFKYRGLTQDINEDWQGEVLTAWDENTYKYLKELLEIK